MKTANRYKYFYKILLMGIFIFVLTPQKSHASFGNEVILKNMYDAAVAMPKGTIAQNAARANAISTFWTTLHASINSGAVSIQFARKYGTLMQGSAHPALLALMLSFEIGFYVGGEIYEELPIGYFDPFFDFVFGTNVAGEQEAPMKTNITVTMSHAVLASDTSYVVGVGDFSYESFDSGLGYGDYSFDYPDFGSSYTSFGGESSFGGGGGGGKGSLYEAYYAY